VSFTLERGGVGVRFLGRHGKQKHCRKTWQIKTLSEDMANKNTVWEDMDNKNTVWKDMDNKNTVASPAR
jgi:hypothetical protein